MSGPDADTDVDADVTSPIDRARAAGRTTLTEPAAKRLLADAGVAVPEGRTVTDPAGAVAAADDLGYPVAVKIRSPAVTHKADFGDGVGVVVDVADAAGVRAAAEHALAAAASRLDHGADVGLYVERSVGIAGVECVVGGTRHPSFGPTVLVGLGGTFVEVFADVTHRLAPIDVDEAHAMLDELQATRLLDGYRGGVTVDRAALARAVVAVGDCLVAHPELAELECNPLLATADGAVALDALATLTDPDAASAAATEGQP